MIRTSEAPLTYEVVTDGLRFPEGPIAMSDGSVVLVEIARGTLTRVSPDGTTTVVAECGGGPNGAAVGPDGAIYVANNGGCFDFIDLGAMMVPGPVPDSWWGHGSIQRVDLDTGEVTTLYTECDGLPLRAPNDLVFDDTGGFWFTDHGVRLERSSDRTGVYYARPDGSSITEVLFPLDAPNGVGLSPTGDHVYVAETHTGRLWQWEVPSPGTATLGLPINAGGTLLYGAPGLRLFDSLGVDGDGFVCVATLGEGGISAVAPDGSEVEFWSIDDPVVTNICFGGDDLRTAWITSSATGRLLRATWPRAGLELPFNR
jgi:gluconolactonase